MSTTSTTSEILLAKLACEKLMRHPHPRILIGGLGLGFSLKAVLGSVGKKAEVHVSELLPEVVDWNRKFLMKVNGALLNDRRVTVFTEDVSQIIRRVRNRSLRRHSSRCRQRADFLCAAEELALV